MICFICLSKVWLKVSLFDHFFSFSEKKHKFLTKPIQKTEFYINSFKFSIKWVFFWSESIHKRLLLRLYLKTGFRKRLVIDILAKIVLRFQIHFWFFNWDLRRDKNVLSYIFVLKFSKFAQNETWSTWKRFIGTFLIKMCSNSWN